MAHHCRDFADDRARPRRARPAGDRARHARARRAPGSSRRGFLLRSAGLALAVYGGGRLAPLAARGRARAGARRRRARARAGLPRGRPRLRLLPRADRGRRPTGGCGRGSRSRPAPARRSRRTGGCAGTRRPRRSPTLHAEGKVSVLPAVGYEHPDQSHFVSRHFHEVGALDPRLATGWMGRYLDRVGTMDNPLQGLALTARSRPRSPPRRVPGRRGRRARGTTTSGRATCGATSRR